MTTLLLAATLLLRAPIGVSAFTRVDLLPYLQPNVQTHEFTSYDRAGDNYDADYFPIYKESNGEQVLFDSYGPGCLYRLHMNIWNGEVGATNIRFYFDNEAKPRIDMDVTEFFSPDNPLGIFKEPLAHIGGGYRILYHPFFYLHRLKIALSREPLGKEPGWEKLPWLGRYDKHPYRRNHRYEFTYHTYSQNPGIESWSKPAEMSAVADFWDPEKIGSPIPNLGNGPIRQYAMQPPPGGSLKITMSKPGLITRLAMPPGADPEVLKDDWLSITFDGAKTPQVNAPLGCFFGEDPYAPGKRIGSRLVGFKDGFYCYFPMPFWKSAVIAVSNRGSSSHVINLQIQSTSDRISEYPKETCGHFHAIYHMQSPGIEGHDYRYADLHGRGQLVGHLVYRKDTSMEEDERTYFDGSRTPSIIGEGFEDDQNQGWGLRDLQRAMWGSVASDGGAGAPWRFYIPESYVFQSSIRAGHQVYGPHSPRGHEGMYQVGEEQSVAFAYFQDEQGLKLTDELDICNPPSERQHHYRVIGTRFNTSGAWWYDGEENNVLFSLPPVVDDGIATDGGSEFTLKLDPRNHGVRLRRRTDKEDNQQLARVFVDGNLVTERPWYSVDFERSFRNIQWFDSDFEIPPRYTAGKNKIKIRIQFVSSKTHQWEEFRYWAFCYR